VRSNYSCMDFNGSFAGRKTVPAFLDKIINLPVTKNIVFDTWNEF